MADAVNDASRPFRWRIWQIVQIGVPTGLIVMSIVLGWFVALRYRTALENAVISSWQATQLEVVRSVARSITQYVADHAPPYQSSLSEMEQTIFKRFVAPVQLLENGDAWIYAPDHVVFDLSSDFPEMYRGKSMAQIFEVQRSRGAANFVQMCNDVAHAREGSGWYIWLPEKGREIAAWTPVRFGGYIWTIGLSTPLNEIMQATGATNQNRIIFMVMGFASLLGAVLAVTFIVTFAHRQREDIARQESHSRLQQAVADLRVEVARRIRTEGRLKKTNARFNTLIEAIPDSIFLKSNWGRYLVVNRSFEQLMGRDRSDLLGASEEVSLPEWLDDNARSDLKALESAVPSRCEKSAVSADGRELFLEVIKTPVLDEKGKSAGLVGMIRDVTEIKLAESERRRLGEQLMQLQKMEAIGTLAGGVAHDLNNILAGLVSYPELLITTLPENSPLKRPLETIQKSGLRAADIVQDLLILARRGVKEKTALDLNTVIEEYLASPTHLKTATEKPLVSITAKLAGDLLPINATASDLSKSVMNLVINALEAIADKGSVVITTENWYVDGRQTALTDIPEGEYVRLSVKDSGEGIAPDMLPRIFEPFYSRKMLKRSGSGLGLAVVWGTVQDHGGYINVRSTPEQGTRFELYFPSTRTSPQKEERVPLETLHGAGQTVLVVDDIPMQCDIARAILERLGYRVWTVHSGAEAVEYIKQQHVDLVVLDMIMDGMDGLDTYREILKIHPGQKAIIASGFSESERVSEARRLGAGAYLKKPYLMQNIGQAVRAVLHRQT